MAVKNAILVCTFCVGFLHLVLGSKDIDLQSIFKRDGLIWAEESNGITYIKYAELASSTLRKPIQSHQTINLARYDNVDITHIAVDVRNMTIVMSDRHTRQIKALTIANFDQELNGIRLYWNLSDGTSNKVNGLAIDEVTDIVYWTDAVYDVILAVSLFMPNMPRVIIDKEIDEPYGIATYPEKGYLFWTDVSDKNPRLMRSTLGGKEVRKLLSFSTNRRAYSLFMDHVKERVYWMQEINSDDIDIDAMQNIASCDIDGRSVHFIDRKISTRYYDVALFKETAIFIGGSNINTVKMDEPIGIAKPYSGAKPKALTVLSARRNLFKRNPCNESLCPGLCTGSNSTVDCFCMRKSQRPTWHKEYCDASDSKPYHGLMIPSGNGTYTVQTNFIEYINLPSSPRIPLIPVVSSDTTILAVATDNKGEKLYFYEYKTQMIKCVRTDDNSNPRVVSTAIGKLGGMALDWNTNNLYWTDLHYKHIMVSKDDGRFPVLLHAGLKKPKAIAIHPFRRYLFWTDSDDHTVMRSYLDGSGKKTILKKTYEIVDIAVDIEKERLYLVSINSLYEMDLNGDNFITHYNTRSQRNTFTGVTIYHDYVVVSDTNIRSRGLLVFDHTRRVEDTIPHIGSLTYPYYLYGNLYGVRYHHRGLKYDYETNYDQCEHLTLLGKDSVTCRCTIGYKRNGSACDIDDKSKPFLFVADLRYNKLLQLQHPSPWNQWDYVAVPVQATDQPCSVAYDSHNKMVYWTDMEARTISRATMDGSNQEIVLYNGDTVFYDLFIDSDSRLLYYTMVNASTHHYLQLDGSIIAYNIETGMSVPVIDRKLLEPYSLTVNVEHGIIFVIDGKDVIKRVYYINNSDTQEEPILNMNATIVTTFGSYLYFAHGNRQYTQIVQTDLFGFNYTVLFELIGGPVIDMKIHGQDLYWINGSTRGVQKMKLDGSGVIENVGYQDYLMEPTSIYVMPVDTYYDSPCANVDCDGVCIPSPSGGLCVEANISESNLTGYCRIPSIVNGEISINEIGRAVPDGYSARVTCYPVHTISNNEPITCRDGHWTHIPSCTLDYEICGTQTRGYKIYKSSGLFFAHPQATKVEVICIGGGGGGYDVMNSLIVNAGKAGDGGTSSFGDKSKAAGGEGGSLTAGGKGGYGHFTGGDGTFGTGCIRGGLACGKGNKLTNAIFCGAGGYSSECSAMDMAAFGSGYQETGPGGTEGNWSTAGFYGGGAGSNGGGTGGGAGSSRMTLILEPRELINVTVGQSGRPSYGRAGPGLVIVMWGNYRIDKLVNNHDLLNECAPEEIDVN